jgi:hypothetical protein
MGAKPTQLSFIEEFNEIRLIISAAVGAGWHQIQAEPATYLCNPLQRFGAVPHHLTTLWIRVSYKVFPTHCLWGSWRRLDL